MSLYSLVQLKKIIFEGHTTDKIMQCQTLVNHFLYLRGALSTPVIQGDCDFCTTMVSIFCLSHTIGGSEK